MATRILADTPFPASGIWSSESYPFWARVDYYYSYARTSPRSDPAKYSHTVQKRLIADAVRNRNPSAQLARHYDEHGIDGRFLHSKHRQGWNELIARAQVTHRPIVMLEITRPLRGSNAIEKLSRLGVHFVSVFPPHLERRAVHSQRVRHAHGQAWLQDMLFPDNPALAALVSEYFSYQCET